MKIRKMLKSALAVAAAAVMVLGTTVFAADPVVTAATIDYTKTGTISLYKLVDNDGNVEDGTTLDGQQTGRTALPGAVFSYLKIADIEQLTVDGTSRVYYKDLSEDFTAICTEAGVTLTGTTISSKTYYTAEALNAAMTAIKAADGGEAAFNAKLKTKGTAMTATDASGYTEAANLPLGLYAVAETTLPPATNGVAVIAPSSPFLISLPMTNITAIGSNEPGTVWQYQVYVYPKNQTASIEKNIVSDDGNSLITADDRSIGDKVTQVISSDVPVLADGKTNKTYKITDTMDAGLTLDENSIAVTYGTGDWKSTGNASLTKTTDYTVSTTDTTFTVTLTAAGLAKLDAIEDASKVFVKFDATLNGSATIGTTANTNTPTLTYQNSASTETEIEGNTPEIYTYEIDLTKQFESVANPDFTKVKFKVTKDGTELKFVLVSDGTYHLYDTLESGTQVTEVSPNTTSGLLKLQGLDEGTYVITETATMGGQNLMADPITVVFSGEDDPDGSIKNATIQSGSDEAVEVTDTASLDEGIVPLTVMNNEVIDVLHTGGTGLPVMFGLAAALLICAFMLYRFAKKRSIS